MYTIVNLISESYDIVSELDYTVIKIIDIIDYWIW